MEFKCGVHECPHLPRFLNEVYCDRHKRINVRFGTPTPQVPCWGCGVEFTLPHSAFRGRNYCNHCIHLLTMYSYLITPGLQLPRYHMNEVQYIKLHVAQGFSCLLCEAKTQLFIDHDHGCCPKKSMSCGKCVRGLLCGTCNIIVGYVENRRDVVERVPQYLNRGYVDLTRANYTDLFRKVS